jgi:hypothetical protein
MRFGESYRFTAEPKSSPDGELSQLIELGRSSH